MKNLKLLIFFAIVVIITACSNNQPIHNDQSFLEIKIPVNDFQPVKMTDIISEYRIVPLEFTNNSMISGLYKIVIHDDLIYILDSFGTQSVLVFNLNGKFIRSISQKGNGPGEITNPMDFLITPDEKSIDVLGYKKVNSFTLKGELIRESSYDFSSTKFTKLENSYYFSAPYDVDCLLYKTDENFNFKSFALLHKNKASSGVIVYCPFLQTESTYFTYWALANDTIYKINEKNSLPHRAINFGKFTFDYKEYSLLSDEEKAMRMMFNKKRIEKCLINKYFETEDYIEIQYRIKGLHCAFIYNKKTRQSVHYDQKHLTDDITGLNMSDIIPSLIGCDNDNFYYMVEPYNYKSSAALLKFMNNASNKEKFTVEDVERLSNNPIILITKYDF